MHKNKWTYSLVVSHGAGGAGSGQLQFSCEVANRRQPHRVLGIWAGLTRFSPHEHESPIGE